MVGHATHSYYLVKSDKFVAILRHFIWNMKNAYISKTLKNKLGKFVADNIDNLRVKSLP